MTRRSLAVVMAIVMLLGLGLMASVPASADDGQGDPLKGFMGAAKVGNTLETASFGQIYSYRGPSCNDQAVLESTNGKWTIQPGKEGRWVHSTYFIPPFPRVTNGCIGPITKGTFSVTAAISGFAQVGMPLTASTDPLPAGAKVSYLWKANETVLAGVTGSAFTPHSKEIGDAITVTITAGLTGYEDAVNESDPTEAVDSGLPHIAGLDVQITGDAKVGQTLKATVGKPIPKRAKISYQWNADGAPIDKATKSSFKIAKTFVGAKITVTVTAMLNGYADTSHTSDPTAKVRPDKPAITVPDTVSVGESFEIYARGFNSGQAFTTELDGHDSLGGFADANGDIEIVVAFPVGTKLGKHRLEIDGHHPSSEVKQDIVVTDGKAQ